MIQPSLYTNHLKMMDYIKVYLLQIHTPDTMILAWWVLVALAFAFFRLRNFGIKDRYLYLLIINVFYMSAHWILFPQQNDRLLFTSYLLVVVLGIVTVGELLKITRMESTNNEDVKELGIL